VITLVSGRLVVQTMRIQRATVEQINGEARISGILRRLREDAVHAVDAGMESEDRLRLTIQPNVQSVVYEVRGDRLTRVEKNADGTLAYEWACEGMVPHLQIEEVGSSGRLAWITFEKHSPRQEALPAFRLSAAVIIGTGGVK
jgi:hypothetical protein